MNASTIRRKSAFRPNFERLEDRRLLTTAVLQNGVLLVEGTIFNDTIRLRQINNEISIDGLSQKFAVSQVQKIEVNAGRGNDFVYLNSESVAGQQAIQRPCLVNAGSGHDTVMGSSVADALFGESGNDKVWAGGGNDFLDGGSGNDTLFGQNDADKLFGDLGDDYLVGELGNDYQVGGDGADVLWGGAGADFLDGSRGSDSLYGESGYDYVYEDASGNYISDRDMNRSVGHFGWFDMKIDDAKLRTTSRFLDRDNSLDRVDVMQVFDVVEADNTVTSTEFNDLKDIVAGGEWAPHLPEHVRVLADKVVNGDAANAHYQGSTLGNLSAGCTGTHLDRLSDKWFLGADRPTAASGTYIWVAGALFQNGVSFMDIAQGGVGDCYFLAALATTADVTPSTIQNMFIDNGDGTFTVRFYKNASTVDYVTVDRFLPTSVYGTATYASFGGASSATTNELWVSLAEKAYAQLNESGWIGQDGTNTYAGLDVGKPHQSMTHLTGRSSTGYANLKKSSVIAAFNANKLVAFSSKKDDADIPDGLDVVAHHVYALVGYNPATAQFTLYNPWGSTIQLSWTQITQGFRAWHYSHT